MTNLSTIIDDLNSFEEERILIGDILDKFENRGFAVILFIIAIPLALPIPAPPPLNFLFGIPLLFLTGQIILGFRKPWLPTWIRSKGFSPDMVDKSTRKLGEWLEFINRYVKPRGGLLMGSLGLWLLGLCSLIMSLSIFTIYPMSNTVPSLFIALSAFGRMTGDGLIMVIGMIGGLVYVTLLILLSVLLGAELLSWLY